MTALLCRHAVCRNVWPRCSD